MPKNTKQRIIDSQFGSRTGGGGAGVSGAGSGGGVIDHGGLTGLEDDDHTQYFNASRGDARYALISHDIIANHMAPGADAWDVVGKNAAEQLAYLPTTTDAKNNPGQILRADNAGDVFVNQLTADQVNTPVIHADILTLDTSDRTIWKNRLYSSNYVSSTSGIGMDAQTGTIDAQFLQAKELVVETFTAAVKRALAGSLVVSVSESLTSRRHQLPLVHDTEEGLLYIWDIPGHTGMDAMVKNSWGMIPFTGYGDTVVGLGDFGRGAFSAGAKKGPNTIVTYIDEDWYWITQWTLQGSDWLSTGNGNSMAADWSRWYCRDEPGVQNHTLGCYNGASNSHAHNVVTSDLENIEFSARIYLSDAGDGWGLTAYSQYPTEDAYIRIRKYGNNDIEVYPHGYSMPTGGTSTMSLTMSAQTWYNVKAQLITNADKSVTTKFRIWEEGTTEPSTWPINCVVPATGLIPEPGKVGFWGHSIADYVLYDDIVVKSLGAVAAPLSLPVYTNVDGGVDEVLVAVVTYRKPGVGSVTVTPPSGWIARGPLLNEGDLYGQLYTRNVGSTDTSETYTFAVSAEAESALVSVVRVRGVNAGYVPTITSGTDNIAVNWTFPAGWDSNSPSHLRLNLVVRDSDDAWEQMPDNAAIAGYEWNDNVSHTWIGRQAEGGWYPPAQLILYKPHAGMWWQIEYPELQNTISNKKTVIGRAYVELLDRYDPGDLEEGEQCWKFTLLGERTITDDITGETYTLPASRGANAIVPADTPVINYGNTGDGVIDLTTLDKMGSPYLQFGIVKRHPTQIDAKVRIGQLKGITGYDSFGLVARHAGAALEISSRTAELRNVPFRLADGLTVDTVIDPARGIRLRAIDYDTYGIPTERTRGIDWATDDTLSDGSIISTIHSAMLATDHTMLSATASSVDANHYAQARIVANNPKYYAEYPQGHPLGPIFRSAYVSVRSPYSGNADSVAEIFADSTTISGRLGVLKNITEPLIVGFIDKGDLPSDISNTVIIRPHNESVDPVISFGADGYGQIGGILIHALQRQTGDVTVNTGGFLASQNSRYYGGHYQGNTRPGAYAFIGNGGDHVFYTASPGYANGDLIDSWFQVGRFRQESRGVEVAMVELIATEYSTVSARSGYGRIWIDQDDGDLKITFGNGVTKTIATN